MNKQHQRKHFYRQHQSRYRPGPVAAVCPVRLDDLLQARGRGDPSAIPADLKAEYVIRCMFDEEWR